MKRESFDMGDPLLSNIYLSVGTIVNSKQVAFGLFIHCVSPENSSNNTIHYLILKSLIEVTHGL